MEGIVSLLEYWISKVGEKENNSKRAEKGLLRYAS
jgi:hypothetical protein